MKLLIASDIHGDFSSAEAIISAFNHEECNNILLLGDILYHGPRNDLPDTYAPKLVIALLNSYSDKIIAVRGNCDAEVDQMVLNFPIMDDYRQLQLDGLTIFATHGHHHNTQTPPTLNNGDILLHGHTHVLKIEKFGNNNTYINPGSIALPKEGNPRSYMLYENRCFTIKDINGKIITQIEF